ncbi:MAG: hypothetical protein JNM41_04595 [Flavipsychrobacter sp.]|nr:hypothetical protein [Flavipsychrobacter sp.]
METWGYSNNIIIFEMPNKLYIMNSQQNLKRRVLRMFPVRLVKEHFNLTGHQSDVVNEIVEKNTINSIYTFALNNVSNTKQHVYIYNYRIGFNENNFVVRDFPLPVNRHFRDANGYHIHCMPIVKFSATIKDLGNGSYTDVVMNFPQPIVITVTGSHVIIRATILEKNVGSYIAGGNSESFNVSKDVEDDFTSYIVEFFSAANYRPTICDINTGIKSLCDNNILDFRSLKVLKVESTATEVMHGEKTFKQTYPDEYAATMLNPLSKSIFKYIPADDRLCRNFAADPNIGKLSITLFPENPHQVNNLITQILINN